MVSSLNAQWVKQESNTKKELNGIDFKDANIGFVVGDFANILYTSDGGSNWTIQARDTTEESSLSDLKSVSIYEQNVTTVGTNGIVIGTTNNGDNWHPNTTNSENTYYDAVQMGNGTYYYAGTTDFIVKVVDGDAELLYVDKDSNLNNEIIYNIAVFGDNIYALLYGQSSLGASISGYFLYKSSDGGENFEEIEYWARNSSRYNGYDEFFMLNESTGWIGGAEKINNNWYADLTKLSNGDTTESLWGASPTDFHLSNSVRDIYFISESKGWILIDVNTILRTEDGGETWNDVSEGIDDTLNAIYFVDGQIGYAVGYNGSIYKTTNGGGEVTSVEDNMNDELPSEFKLAQNYPNPFNPSTKISYSIPNKSQVSLKVFDVLGNEVAELVNSAKPAGSYEVSLNAENLSSGIYFYTLSAGSVKETKKMMLVR
jgi:photosystem II stability/assembly factor-like uncharacterized protein